MKKNDPIATLELLEERAQVDKYRINKGKVVLSKQTRVRTVDVPIKLTEEYLVIEYQQPPELSNTDIITDEYLVSVIDTPASAATEIHLNGKSVTLSPNAPIEIMLSQETASVHKTTHIVESINLDIHTTTKSHTLTTQLQKEVLSIEDGEHLLLQQKPSDD